jgi:outer membrane protein
MRRPRAYAHVCLALSVLTCAVVLVAAAGRAHAAPPARRLTVEDAIALARANNPQLHGAEEQALAAADRARSVRGRLLPTIKVTEDYQHWNDRFTLALAPGAQVTLRDQDTSTFTASATQPLVGLFRLGHDYGAARANAQAARARQAVGDAEVRAAIESGYLRYFEALALADIARASQAQLREQVRVAEARRTAGIFTVADVLRVRVALASAAQQQIAARSQADVARAELLGLLGLVSDAPVDFAEPTALLERGRASLPSPQAAEGQAERCRPELLQLEHQARAAAHQEKSATYALLPEVDLQAAYLRTDGQGLTPPNQGFLAVRAQWAIFEWGRGWYEKRAAAHSAAAQRLVLADGRRGVATEVQTRLVQAAASTASVDVAHANIASAEEAYRVTDVQLQAGSATTTDLLDAQSALTSARLTLARADYEQALARVALSRAVAE